MGYLELMEEIPIYERVITDLKQVGEGKAYANVDELVAVYRKHIGWRDELDFSREAVCERVQNYLNGAIGVVGIAIVRFPDPAKDGADGHAWYCYQLEDDFEAGSWGGNIQDVENGIECAIGAPSEPFDSSDFDRLVAIVKEQLGEDAPSVAVLIRGQKKVEPSKEMSLIDRPVPTSQLKKMTFSPEQADEIFKKWDKTMRDLANN